MNTTVQAMTSEQIIDLLDANGIDTWEHDLGSSGGGDWWAIRVEAPRDCFILITPAGYPFDLNADDDAEEFLTLNLYGPGTFEDEADRPWTSFGSDDTPATPKEILDRVAFIRTFAETWDFANA